MQGISSSLPFLLIPAISHLPLPPHLKKYQIVFALSCGEWATTTSHLQTTTAYGLFGLSSSTSTGTLSLTTGVHMLVYVMAMNNTLKAEH